MGKLKIQVVKLGTQRYNALFEKLRKYKSDIFEVEIFEKKLPNADYGWGYSFKTLNKLLVEGYDKANYDVCMGFLDYEIEGNLYGKCLDEDKKIYVISFFQGIEILQNENINPFYFVLGAIYRFVCHHLIKKTIVHDETKGCLFDMLGNKWDIVYSASNPILCTECENEIKEHIIPADFIHNLNVELKRIKKAKYYIIANFINKHPYISLLIGFLSGMIINILSSIIYDWIKMFFGGSN